MRYVAEAVRRNGEQVVRAQFDADPAEMLKLVEVMNLLPAIGAITVNVFEQDAASQEMPMSGWEREAIKRRKLA